MKHIQSAFSKIIASAIFLSQVALLPTSGHAANMSEIVPNYHPQTYCTADIEAKTRHPQHTNILKHDIDCMLTALKPYQKLNTVNRDVSVDPNIPYFAYKAQAWLAYAYSENSNNSLNDAKAYALSEGLTILDKLQQNNVDKLALTTDVPPSSAIMRADLWATLMSLKHNGATVNSPRELAFGEVQLIWAAESYCHSGWRHSNEHFKAAEKWINEAHESFINTHSETESLQLQEDTNSMFKMFEKLDTGDNQCLEHKTTSFSTHQS